MGGRRRQCFTGCRPCAGLGGKQGEKLKTMQALDTAKANNVLKTTC